jgi:hypothetical protein
VTVLTRKQIRTDGIALKGIALRDAAILSGLMAITVAILSSVTTFLTPNDREGSYLADNTVHFSRILMAFFIFTEDN